MEPKIGYIFAYQRCCRNGIINNIVDPLETGATFIAEVPPSALDWNVIHNLFSGLASMYIPVLMKK